MHPVFTQKTANWSALRISQVLPNTTKRKTGWQFHFSVQWKPRQDGSRGGRWRGMFRLLDYSYTECGEHSERYTDTSAGSLTAGLPCGYHFICEIVTLFEVRLGDSMVEFLGGKSNATPENSHPLSWEGTVLLLFDVQGSVRETDY